MTAQRSAGVVVEEQGTFAQNCHRLLSEVIEAAGRAGLHGVDAVGSAFSDQVLMLWRSFRRSAQCPRASEALRELAVAAELDSCSLCTPSER
jgi:hypothetical protein